MTVEIEPGSVITTNPDAGRATEAAGRLLPKRIIPLI